MSKAAKTLADAVARKTALLAHDRSLLVEAGAGSGKTAILAGRIALILAAGIAPKTIAAVTFTELAASELLFRVRDFVDALLQGKIPPELEVALPTGLTKGQRTHLQEASANIDDILCSTIHGFCRRLIAPYPVEANIDPGATVLDKETADLVFNDLADQWLREQLDGTPSGAVAALVLNDAAGSVHVVTEVLDLLRHNRTATVGTPPAVPQAVKSFGAAVKAFDKCLKSAAKSGLVQAESRTIVDQLDKRHAELAQLKDTPHAWVTLLNATPPPSIAKVDGDFKSYRFKGKWQSAAKDAGLKAKDGDPYNDQATSRYDACAATWQAMQSAAATCLLAELVDEVRPALQRFHDYKRAAAALDFDDLITAARDLLRKHDPVRRALGERYAHLLVDEFQDTDPLQTEIFWRLCGDPPAGRKGAKWNEYVIRMGALFLVGDPKQAIYRFRGADVNAYTRARDAFHQQDPKSILSIATNFRSMQPVLDFVNDRFGKPLAIPGQPGFTSLTPFHGGRRHGNGLCVAALDVAVAGQQGTASADAQRDGEAEQVALLCAALIGSEQVIDHHTGGTRACRPGDIALLAPTGSALWRYEEALERCGVPVATQAGKGLYRRQEIQDLIALTRVLADAGDRLALGALLRGPLVGLTEQELLDIVWNLPRSPVHSSALPKLDLRVDPEAIANPLACDILGKLIALRQRINSTTPYDLLAHAVDVLRVRAILGRRHRGQADRVLANVDLYLDMARAYGVRGLRAFSDAMTAAWTDETRAVEGRPDAQADAVALYTMHAAKGLEWPVVIPINTMTTIRNMTPGLVDRALDQIWYPILGVSPEGYDAATKHEGDELERERVRLWYVAATRARELLILPRLDVALGEKSYGKLIDLAVHSLKAIALPAAVVSAHTSPAQVAAPQSAAQFAQEVVDINALRRGLRWRAPSRSEGVGSALVEPVEPDVFPVAGADAATLDPATSPTVTAQVRGGRERGLVIHKLLEEVLTKETTADEPALQNRADALLRELGQQPVTDPAKGFAPAEIARCVVRTLALPEVAALRPRLVPEFPVNAVTNSGNTEEVTAGIVDATTVSSTGAPEIIVDWKSDVSPDAATVAHYRDQMRQYLGATGATRGLVVFVTTGAIEEVFVQSK